MSRWSIYRADHPEYREREAARRRERHRRIAKARAERVSVALTDVLMSLAVDEAEATSVAALAIRLGRNVDAVHGWMRGAHLPDADGVDAMMAAFSWHRVLTRRADLRAAYHTDPGRHDDLLSPAGSSVAPGPYLPKELARGGRHPWRAWTAA